MALDGIFLHRLRREIADAAVGARVEKISQPAKDELVLTLRRKDGGGKLLFSANAGSARVHFTGAVPENPKSPPMFCMLLRKRLSGARLSDVRQIALDRVIHFVFEARNELGDQENLTLAVEIMGRHSNIILLDGDGLIIDAIKRVDPEMSGVRHILPGLRYELPPPQNKLNLLETAPEEILARLEDFKAIELSKALITVLQGVSPPVAREIAHFANRGESFTFAEMDISQRERLLFFLKGLIRSVENFEGALTMVLEPSGRPRDFSCIPINQYGAAMATREYETCGELLDAFYARRDLMGRMNRRAADLLRVLSNANGRIARKLAAQRLELLECAERGSLRMKGDLITANIYRLQKGDTIAKVQNLYDPEGGEIEIELDVMLSPVKNAQRYYALYRKADTAEKMLKKLIAAGEDELAYVDSVFDALTRADSEAALQAIRDELEGSGYIRRAKTAKQKKNAPLPPLEYLSSDGFTILCGRNNIQNDRLTLKESRGSDIWLHTQKIPGSHTVILARGGEVPRSTIEQACAIAAYHSKARDSSKVPVDFTQIKNVKKPGGAKPGMVIYDNYQTVIIDPELP